MKNIFELYESEAGWEEATIDIKAVIKVARNDYVNGRKDADEAFKEISSVLRKYSPWGACDSEPEWAAAKTFCAGTDLDPSDFA